MPFPRYTRTADGLELHVSPQRTRFISQAVSFLYDPETAAIREHGPAAEIDDLRRRSPSAAALRVLTFPVESVDVLLMDAINLAVRTGYADRLLKHTAEHLTR